jgi:glycosyltransferase involved in cell wall biosynthesis
VPEEAYCGYDSFLNSDCKKILGLEVSLKQLKIINFYDGQPSNINWLEHAFVEKQQVSWMSIHNQSQNVPRWMPLHYQLSNIKAALRFNLLAKLHAPSLAVYHGPRPAFYANAIQRNRLRTHDLAFSFNFTDLPQGLRRRLMAKSFRHIERFVVFSKMEIDLYSQHFDLPQERFKMIHWAVEAPRFESSEIKSLAEQPFVCALGSQARDYAIFMNAASLLPSIRFKVVAWPQNLQGLSIPRNVEVFCNIPRQQAMNILGASQFMVLPLRNSATPCGHVTIVSAMHSGKAVIATDSVGIRDYLQHGVTGKLVEPSEPKRLAEEILRLWDDADLRNRLALNAKAFAQSHCTEQNTVDYLDKVISELQMA